MSIIDSIKIKILLFVILAMASNLTVKNITALKANIPHEGGITWQTRYHLPVMLQGRLQKNKIMYRNHQSYQELIAG